MRTRRTAILWAMVASTIGIVAALLLLRPTTPVIYPTAEQERRESGETTPARPNDQKPPQRRDEPPTAKALESDSPEKLADFIRQFAAAGASANELYRKLAAFGLKDQPWWRTTGDFSELLDLAFDPSIAEQYRVIAMGLYLAGATQDQIVENSAAIQQLAIAGSDSMASSVLQGMADRSIAPSVLTKETLTSETRGTGAKCYAWYAARLTQKNDPALAALAIDAPETGMMTEATKVGFDYLASGPFHNQFTADPQFRQGVEASVVRVKSLQPDADPMDIANGDAFIRAVPCILPADAAVEALFVMLHETSNPELRLSVIEQIVSIHISGTKDLTQDLREVRNQIATLFSDPVKQARAKKRLNRAVPTKEIN